MIRTSSTHPLRIDSLSVGSGSLGLTICPGKSGSSLFGAPWQRDLKTDLEAIQGWGATTVVTLVEPHELHELGVRELGSGVKELGLTWHYYPFPDGDIPRDLPAWESLSPLLHQELDQGGRVIIHCRGGLGRAGTIASLLLIERGDDADEAMRRVRDTRVGAVETAVQEAFLRERAELDNRRTERIRASLFGGAIGDALGAEIEFWSLAQILERFPDGVNDMLPHDGHPGAITDDTQMTLFSAEGLMRAVVRSQLKGICHPASVIHHALLRWFITQGGTPACETDDIGLLCDPRLHRRRAPGMACLSGLSRTTTFGEAAKNDSKGCGTIMRVGPVGLMGFDIEQTARESSALTHGHVTGQEAAVAWALMLNAVLEGEELETAARQLVGKFGPETNRALEQALAAPRDGRPETVESLGAGWVAEEALAIALFAALVVEGADDGLRIAVTHSGDSDSTGAIAGNMLGLLYPEEMMAHPWRQRIECADLIDGVARDLAAISSHQGDITSFSERYPGA